MARRLERLDTGRERNYRDIDLSHIYTVSLPYCQKTSKEEIDQNVVDILQTFCLPCTVVRILASMRTSVPRPASWRAFAVCRSYIQYNVSALGVSLILFTHDVSFESFLNCSLNEFGATCSRHVTCILHLLRALSCLLHKRDTEILLIHVRVLVYTRAYLCIQISS